ncbi:LPXTG cell wall anchor domain-containing protein [Candidatus Woesearchaeota archaeon]|nr:LPXTG cell wall anchor domain-containing protein [Candidatus Woesearchaeota archaeon]
MKKVITILLAVIALMTTSVFAFDCGIGCPNPDINVFVHDQDGNPLNDLTVRVDQDGWFGYRWTPNWRTGVTNVAGFTPTWTAQWSTWYRAKVTDAPDGWTCSGYVPDWQPPVWDSTFAHAYTDGQLHTTIDIECVVPEEIPEFTTISAALALVGAGLFIAKKRKKE